MALSAFSTRARAVARKSAASSSVAIRPVVVVHATPAEQAGTSAAAPAAGSATVYFGGKEYTEEQWAAAVASGSVVPAPTPRGGVGAAAGSGAGVATVGLAEAMAFSGKAPELINGRLAMLGFVAAVAAEFSSGEGVLQQWASEPTGIAAAFALFAAASFPPILAGKTESLGPFTPEAEKLNGRAAMIGFAALLVIEGFKHGPLF